MLSKVHRFLSLLYFFSIFTFLFLYGIRVCAFVNEAPLSYQQVTRQHLGESSQTFLPFPEKGKEMFFLRTVLQVASKQKICCILPSAFSKVSPHDRQRHESNDSEKRQKFIIVLQMAGQLSA